jgi:dihydroorotase
MNRLVIRNGRVIDPANQIDRKADILVVEGKIAGIGDYSAESGEILDATGLIVAPGFIDMHVHLREPGFEHAETIETGARAAAAGGFATVACMPNTNPVNDSPTVTSFIVERARRHAVINVLPIGAITKGSKGEELAQIGAMCEAGVVAISDDGKPVMNARVMRHALETAKSFGIPVIQHCEDLHLSHRGDMHEGVVSTKLGVRGIPAAAEDVMVARDILLAEMTGARYHVAHLSTKHAMAMVAFAKMRGLPITCEVCPHHFAISDEEIIPYDSNFKMKPPLRGADHVEAMLMGIAAGTVDALATDHAPHSGHDKMQEFERCPFGILGLETAIPLSLQRLVRASRIDIKRMIELYTTGPASVLNVDKGTLSVGKSADITLIDEEARWTYDVHKSPSKSRNSPFHGTEFQGGAAGTIVNGQLIWWRGEFRR